jgi:hypothetical protein
MDDVLLRRGGHNMDDVLLRRGGHVRILLLMFVGFQD